MLQLDQLRALKHHGVLEVHYRSECMEFIHDEIIVECAVQRKYRILFTKDGHWGSQRYCETDLVRPRASVVLG